MNPQVPPHIRLTENGWRGIILTLSIAVIFFTVWCLTHGIITIFMHLYYFPIVLLAYRYRWKGCGLATLLALAYLGLVMVFDAGQTDVILGEMYRFLVFVGIAAVIAYLSEQLKQSETLLNEIGEMAHVGGWELDVRTKEVHWTKETYRIHDISEDEKFDLSKAVLFFDLPDRSMLEAALQRCMEKGEPFDLELPFTSAKGRHLWTRAMGRAVSVDGNVVKLAGTFQDITDHRRMVEALRQSEAKFRSVIENIPDVTWTTDHDGRTVFISSKVETVYGFTPEEIYREGDTIWLGRIHPDDVKNVKEKFQALFERQELFNIEYRIQRKDQSWIWLHDRAVATYEKDGIWYTDGIFMDITERKLTEEALRESEERYRTLAEASPDQIFIVGMDDTMKYVNTACLKLFRLPYDKVIGTSRKDLFPPAIADAQDILLKKVFETGEHVHSEEKIQFGTQEFWIDTSLVPLKDKMENVTAVLGVARDITERKRSEEALRETTEYLQNLFDYANAPIITWDPGFHITRFNHAFEHLTGRSQEEVLGKTLDLLFPDESRKAAMALIQKTLEGERWETVEIPILNTGGSTKTILWNSANVLDSEGKLTATIAQGVDITERKRAERSIRESELRYRMLIDSAAEGILVIDSETHKIRRANPAICRMLGYSEEELTTLGMEHTIPKESMDYVMGEFMAQIRGGKTLSMNVPLLRKDKTIQYTDVKSARILIDEKMSIVGFFTDIAERKKSDDLLKRFNEELEQKVKARTEELNASLDEKILLLREVHHRVNNNLQIIISLINLQMRQTDDPEVKQTLAEMQNRMRAMSLVYEKLYRTKDLSRIDFADYTRFLTTQLFSVYGMDTRRVRLDFTMGKIMVDINTAVPLGLLINELISNALRHAFPDGREGMISISSGDVGDLITLVVCDNGIGIPEELDWKNTTSLGMRLVTSLIDQIDGTITLDRKNGTTFTVTVKREPAAGGTG